MALNLAFVSSHIQKYIILGSKMARSQNSTKV